MTVGGGVVVTVRRVTTRRTGTAATRRCTILRLGLVCFRTAGRLGLSTMCTAPPPITAPPAAQAVSFARAIRTDIVNSSHRTAEWRDRAARPGSLHLLPCHHTDQKSFKGQGRYSPWAVRFWDSRTARSQGTGQRQQDHVMRMTRPGDAEFGFRDSGVENRLPLSSSSIFHSLRNIIIKNIITTKCQSLAASGGTDYRRSRPSGGGSEDAVQKCRADGPFGRVVWRRCLIA